MNMDKWIALVRDRMEELGLTQEQLAERVGVSQGSVGHWVNKRRQPKLESMNRTLVEIGMPHYCVRLQLRIHGQADGERCVSGGMTMMTNPTSCDTSSASVTRCWVGVS